MKALLGGRQNGGISVISFFGIIMKGVCWRFLSPVFCDIMVGCKML